jgi:hypothetical protein
MNFHLQPTCSYLQIDKNKELVYPRHSGANEHLFGVHSEFQFHVIIKRSHNIATIKFAFDSSTICKPEYQINDNIITV